MMELAGVEMSRENRLSVASISGEIDMSNARGIRQRALEWTANNDEGLALDLTGVSYLDSAGLRMVFELSRLLRERSQRLFVLIAPDSQPWRVVQIAGVGEQIELHQSRDRLAEALRDELLE